MIEIHLASQTDVKCYGKCAKVDRERIKIKSNLARALSAGSLTFGPIKFSQVN